VDNSPADVASLVDSARQGDEQALATLVPLVYDELRRLAASYLRRERPGQTLQATALVHDVYLRLLQDSHLSWQNRAHFFGIAAQMMRRILVDHARSRSTAKRGGGVRRVTIGPDIAAPEKNNLDIEALDEALKKLSGFDPRQEKIIELRFFAGLSIEDTAGFLHLSPATVKREWTVAKAWLYREMRAAQ
jgi:RNA polymerase sigma factor (TIGR02999 family)